MEMNLAARMNTSNGVCSNEQPRRTQGKLANAANIENQVLRHQNPGARIPSYLVYRSLKERQAPCPERQMKAMAAGKARSFDGTHERYIDRSRRDGRGRPASRAQANAAEEAPPIKVKAASTEPCTAGRGQREESPGQAIANQARISNPMLTKFYPAINKGGQPFFRSEADPATRHDSIPSESSQSDRRYERAPPPNAEAAKDIFQPDSYTRNWMMKHGK